MTAQPRLIQTFLPDGTLEGPRIIELSESSIKAFVIPRLKLSEVKDRSELLQPALYFLLSSDDKQGYIGESENFYHRVKNHDQNKQWWDIAVAIISNTNSLEKSDVKYLESLAVERAQDSPMAIENKTAPTRNNIHEFKLHILERILDDSQMILTSLGYEILSTKESVEQVWYCNSKKTKAKAIFKGNQFVVLAGSVIDVEPGKGWSKYPQKEILERSQLIESNTPEVEGIVTLKVNVLFNSPNHAGRIILGRSANAWTTWVDSNNKTMDEVMRKLDK